MNGDELQLVRAVGDAARILSGAHDDYDAIVDAAAGARFVLLGEGWSHYFLASLPRQFDFVLHVDQTRAVEPLERSAHWQDGELPETYPEGL